MLTKIGFLITLVLCGPFFIKAQEFGFDETDTSFYSEDDVWDQFAAQQEEEAPKIEKDSILSRIKADIIIKVGKGYIIGVEDPMHDILMDGTERYYYTYGLLDQGLDTILSLEYTSMYFLPQFEYFDDEQFLEWEESEDDFGSPDYQWIMGPDEITFFLGEMSVEKFSAESGHQGFVDDHRAMKGKMGEIDIQECFYQTQAILVDESQFIDPMSLKPLTPYYSSLLLNFSRNLILVGSNKKYGLINRSDFQEVVAMQWDRIILDQSGQEVILIKEISFGQEEIKRISLSELSR